MMNPKEKMIIDQLLARDITDEKVIEAMRSIDREDFVPDEMRHNAYADGPLPIGKGQTISQPYIVAYMAQSLDLQPGDKVLEIGSGCGYNAAVISQIVAHVYSVEIIDWLAKLAQKNIDNSGISNVSIRAGDGYEGWPEKSPFDKIVLTAAAPRVPVKLKYQLKNGGKMLMPVGTALQKLVLMERLDENNFSEQKLIGVRFVPMTH